jgi:hypothetical protein
MAFTVLFKKQAYFAILERSKQDTKISKIIYGKRRFSFFGKMRIAMEKDPKTKGFIEKARKVHGDKYDYSISVYTKANEQIKISCPVHGIFSQRAAEHTRGSGCLKCSGRIKKTTEQFVKECKAIHGDKYDYSNVKYVNIKTKVVIVCSAHGPVEIPPSSHLRGAECKFCGYKKISKTKRGNIETFLEDANTVHKGTYDYSLSVYRGADTKLIIICSKHGPFWQSPYTHIKGHGCRKCADDLMSDLRRDTVEEFIEKAQKIHENKYDYSKVEYGINNSQKVTIICKKHGKFRQRPAEHLQGKDCRKCSSAGFSKVCCEWLNKVSKERNINIVHAGNKGEVRIKTDTGVISFDGFCAEKNTVFEFHGCLWHGCMNCFPPEKVNPINKKRMDDLYDKTARRERIIRDLGFNLEVIWECEYRSIHHQ